LGLEIFPQETGLRPCLVKLMLKIQY